MGGRRLERNYPKVESWGMHSMQHDTMRLALTGDSIITRRVGITLDDATRRLVEMLTDTDVAFTNLEVLPNDFAGYPAVESGGSHFAAHQWVIDDLTDMGFNLFACANNHSLDYSIEGLLAMLEVLNERGISYAGVGENLALSRMPVFLDTPAGSVGMISCSATFHSGQEAGEQRPEMQGRPGLNPLRYDTTYYVTQEQYDAIHQISLDLGIEQDRLQRIQLGFKFPPDDPDVLPFLDANFKVAEKPSVETVPKEKDVLGMEKWVAEARRRSDLVIVSIHAHEQQPDDKEKPADFIKTFAHRMIDAGADMIVGHGPHLIRGMELYQGKPIFYSLGNFIGQNELVWRLPSDSYERFRVDPAETPAAVYNSRYANDTQGFPADSRFWETVMPLVEFDGERVTGIEIVPITLALGPKPQRRGRPQVAVGEEAQRVLERFQRLSEELGTSLRIDAERGHVDLT
jgi:poly-gamma-glutamate capsule biosynthesis protein CapA/YwtB (metallophosphatase superfamily)